ncbi:hypothetical protein D3C83_246810 [compost metagenome]
MEGDDTVVGAEIGDPIVGTNKGCQHLRPEQQRPGPTENTDSRLLEQELDDKFQCQPFRHPNHGVGRAIGQDV